MKLDIGCGPRKTSDEYIGIDRVPLPGVDIQLDLERDSLPFENNSVSEIVASHVLEHVSNFLPLLREIWRVMKPGGVLIVRAPSYKSENAFSDPTHVRFFTRKSFHFYDKTKIFYKETGWYMSPIRFRIESIEEGETQITYRLIAEKKKVLLIAPPESIHTRRWRSFLEDVSHCVTVASRIKKGISDVALTSDLPDKDEDIERMTEALTRLLEKTRFDVVHVHFATKYGHLLRVVPGDVRRIMSVWGEDVLEEALRSKKLEKRLAEGLDNCNAVTVTSSHMAEYLARKYRVDKKKVYVIPWGYMKAVFQKKDPGDISGVYGIPGDRKVILSARVCRPENNVEAIIRAFQKSGVEATLAVLTGSLSNNEYVNKLKQTYGSKDVVFLPTLNEKDLSSMYNRAVATLSIPFVDQLCTTILESLACGTPVIGSDIESYKERIIDGKNGWLVDPRHVDEIAEAIRTCVTAGKRMDKDAMESVVHDSWEDNSERMLAAYDDTNV